MTSLLVFAVLAAPLRAGLYEDGMAARARGDLAAAERAFSEMLRVSSNSAGGLEGMSLVSLSRGQLRQASAYLERWNALNPRSPYILTLLTRAYLGEKRDQEALEVYGILAEIDPTGARARRSLDTLAREISPGLFPAARLRKSLVTEELNTANPQRIVYEGRSGTLRARVRLNRKVQLLVGAEASQDAQRNDTRGFTYYNIFEQVYWGGLEARPSNDLFFEAQHGQSLLHDVQGDGIGRQRFSRLRLRGEWRPGQAKLSLTLTRAPRFLRGAGGNRFFALLRESSARAEAEAPFLGWDWRLRGGLDDYSENTTFKTWSASAFKEFDDNFIEPSASHGQQEFFGAGDDGRLRYVSYDRGGLRARRLREEKYRLSGSYSYYRYRDGNFLHDLAVEAQLWLPWWTELSGLYRREQLDYGAAAAGYRNTDERAHWAGAAWRRAHGAGIWSDVSWEHGFLRDGTRGVYEANEWRARLEWHKGRALTVIAEGRVGRSTVRDDAYSAALNARWSF